MEINEITKVVIGCAIRVHSKLGPGLLESSYEGCLARELREVGLKVRSQVGLPIIYEGVRIEVGYRIDLLVEDSVIVEIKAQEAILPVPRAQLLSHLRHSGKQVGLLINFHVSQLSKGISRIVNNFKEAIPSQSE
jgi:GxxExxY protein